MMNNKKVLGKGLSALISEAAISMANSSNDLSASENIIELPLESIIVNVNQPRKNFSEEELQDLSCSIKEHGVLQPLLVMRYSNDIYQIIAGERRWRAAGLAGCKTIPVIVKNVQENQAFEIAIIENIQREDLKPLEEANAYKKLVDFFDYTQENLASKLGKSRSYVANMLRILKLPNEVKQLIQDNKLSMGHAKVLVTAADPIQLATTIMKNKLSVREAEDLVREKEYQNSNAIMTPNIPKRSRQNQKSQSYNIEDIMRAENSNQDLLQIEEELSMKNNYPIKIIERNEKYYVLLEAKNAALLDGIVAWLNNIEHKL